MKQKASPYCWAPWISFQHGNVLQGNTPCCEWQGDRHSGSIEDYFNGKYLKKIKKAMINKDMDFIKTTCAECIENEEVGIKSRRLRYFDDPHVRENKTESVVYFDYRPSNLCNLKCSMCNPEASSLIAKELKDFVKQDYILPKDYKNFDMASMRQITVIGGEPSIQKEVYDFLDYCCDLGLNDTCHLHFTTNATNCNRQWMSRVEKWKSKSVEISLDGAGKTFEYIRTNSDWKTIEKNCKIYEEVVVDVAYHITALAYNIPNVEDWIEWFLDKKEVAIYPVHGLPYLGMDIIPDDVKNKKLEYLKKFDKPFVNTLIEIIEQSTYNPKLAEKLVYKTKEQQDLRKGDIYSVNEIYKYIIPGI